MFLFVYCSFFFHLLIIFILRWVGRLRTVGIQRDAQLEEGSDTSESFEFLQQGSDEQQEHRRDRSGGSTTQFEEPDQDVPSSPFFSASSTVWGSSIPSTPVRGTVTPVYAGGGGGGTVSPGMTIPIGAMSLSSRYGTPRSLSLADEEEEKEEEEGGGDGMVKKNDLGVAARKGSWKVRVVGGEVEEEEEEEEEENGLKMDVDVDVRG